MISAEDEIGALPSLSSVSSSTAASASTAAVSPASTNIQSSRLMVAVRIRPLNESEKQHPKVFQCVYPLDAQRVFLVDPEKLENNILRQNRQFERQFVFDSAFGPDSTHMQVHNHVTAPLVDYVVSGYNATVFAYGPTGSGKTFTMVGTRQTPGLMTLLTRTLYEKINPDEFTVFISLLEIYNEVIRDLLNPTAGVLDLLEDEKGSVQVPGLSRVKAPNTSKIMQILQEGNMRRTQEPTAANQNSSRSHALLQVSLYKHSVQHGKLFLIDLAGSERASQTQNRGQRLKEGAAINRSLLALGNVINALSSGGKGRYVNYRDSKLTRLLKDSLGGNSMTCMIAHVTPSSAHYDETYNTLIYANRAKNISNRLIRNRRPNSAEAQKTSTADALIDEIRRELHAANAAAAQQQNGGGNAGTTATPLTHHQPAAFASSSQLSATRAMPPPALRGDMPSHVTPTTTNASGGDASAPNSFTISRWNGGGMAGAGVAAAAPAGPGAFGNENAGGQRHFSTLFNALKEQFLAVCEKMQRLRERLLKANYESSEADLNRISKAAILSAWERRGAATAAAADDDDEKYSHVIERIRRDSVEQEKRCVQLRELRQKVERALRNNGESLRSLEKRMRALARDAQQSELVDMLVRMAIRDAESMAATSDSVLQSIRLRRQANSLLKIQKYEKIADRLITANELSEKDRECLTQEYRLVKNQLNFHLIPLKQTDPLNIVSWNTQLLQNALKTYPRGKMTTRTLVVGGGSGGGGGGGGDDASKTFARSRTRNLSGAENRADFGCTYTLPPAERRLSLTEQDGQPAAVAHRNSGANSVDSSVDESDGSGGTGYGSGGGSGGGAAKDASESSPRAQIGRLPEICATAPSSETVSLNSGGTTSRSPSRERHSLPIIV